MADISMPKLSDTMTEGTLVAWKKKAGDPVSSGEVIAEVETDKATMEMESFEDGVLAEIFVQEGQKAAVGEKIARVQGKGEPANPTAAAEKKAAPTTEKAAAKAGSTLAPATASGTQATGTEAAAATSSEIATNGRIKASPLARKTAAARGVELAGVTGSGPGGRIVQHDVLSLGTAPTPVASTPATVPITATAKAAVPAPTSAKKASLPQRETRIPLTGMRKTIADRLLQSKTSIPHFYLHVEVDAEPLATLRAQANAAGEKDGVKLSVNDFILKAVTKALVAYPKVNASFAGDAVIEYGTVNLAVAVAIDDGLITPVIKSAETKSLAEISAEVKDLASRARNKKLKPEEYQGGTFTVSNLGAYGIDRFDAIINPPQAAILSVGGLVKKPVVNKAGAIVAGSRLDLGLSCDHRVVDGALGAQYLAELKRLLESPLLLLM